ncbi:fatty acid hydroxylase superfamily domain-containing protein [Ditylenchus destructor]|nr:fatty acid hydroxylase superfamily domain-containing protein [Ditylenchus destructor]
MTDAQIIVLATPVFFALIGLEYWIGVRRGPQHLSAQRRDEQRRAGHAQPGGRCSDQALHAGHLHLGLRARGADPAGRRRLVGLAERAAALRLPLLLASPAGPHHRAAVGRARGGTIRARTTTCPPRCARPAAAGWSAGSSTSPWPSSAFRRWSSRWSRWSTCFYQFWVHTQQVGRLGWFDRWFCSPSNHRVHHAVNDPYLDRNYGGILVIWDRMFGSFQEELDHEPCVYGTRDALSSWNPWAANVQVYAKLLRKTRSTPRWRDKLRLWWEPAHWEPGIGARHSARIRPRARSLFDPVVSSSHRAAAALLFVLLLIGVALFLWNAHRLGPAAQIAVLMGLLAGQAATARLLTPRPVSSTPGHP